MLGGFLSFFGPSILLSTIFRGSSNACVGVTICDEDGLPRQVEPVEVVSLGLEDHPSQPTPSCERLQF
jgi:hypothetical protein